MRTATFLLVIVMLISCKTANVNVVDKGIYQAKVKLSQLVEAAVLQNSNPRNSDSLGNVRWLNENYDWTEGFFPGSLWLMYGLTSEDEWIKKAERFQHLFHHHKDQKNDHDMGFIFNCSYGNAYKYTGKEEFKAVFIDAANSLMKSFDPEIGLIMSWDVTQDWVQKLGWQYPVIIDNMMNLELLFEATNFTGDSTYWKAAISHANKTMANHFRSDNSSFHVLDYDSIDGSVRIKQTNQGFADESAWARGQSWGLYGFTLSYRYTKDEAYLKQAKAIADFLIGHPRMPKDKVPYWDYDAPKIPNTYRDASAAAIMASALIELDKYAPEKGYLNWAEGVVMTLTENHCNLKDDKSKFILKNSVGNWPINSEINVSINYADYYYLEALLRLKK